MDTATFVDERAVPVMSRLMLTELPDVVWMLCIVGILGYFYLLRHYLEHKKPFPSLPMARGSHWLLGHLQVIGKCGTNFQASLEILGVNSANAQGRTGYWLLSTPAICLSDWRDARQVLLKTSHRLSIPVLTTHMCRMVGRKNILVLMGKEWKVHRALIHQGFRKLYTEASRRRVAQITQDMIQTLSNKISGSSSLFVEDCQEIFQMIAVDVFGQLALDWDFQSCTTFQLAMFAQTFEAIQTEVTRRLFSPLNPFNLMYSWPQNSPANQQYQKDWFQVRSFLDQMIQTRQKQLQEEEQQDTSSSSTKREDLLTNLLQARAELKAQSEDDADCGPEDNEALKDILLSLLFGGYETTKIALSYAMYMLSQHPAMEQICLEEIQNYQYDESPEGSDCSLMYDPSQLVYCKAVILESLRLFPPAYQTVRGSDKPITLKDGFTIPKGTNILIPTWLIHHNSAVFPQAQDFRPDRWVYKAKTNKWVERTGESADERDSCSIPQINHQAIFTFSVGGRNCPGEDFFLQEAILVLAAMLKSFSFSIPEGTADQTKEFAPCPVRHGFVQRPQVGIPMRIQRRVHESTKSE